jgi:hypothetical protein
MSALEIGSIALVSAVVQAVRIQAVRLGLSSWSGFPKRGSATPNRLPARPLPSQEVCTCTARVVALRIRLGCGFAVDAGHG